MKANEIDRLWLNPDTEDLLNCFQFTLRLYHWELIDIVHRLRKSIINIIITDISVFRTNMSIVEFLVSLKSASEFSRIISNSLINIL